MKHFFIFSILFVFVFVSGFSQDEEIKEITSKLSDNHIHIKGTKLSIVPPEGYDLAVDFTGIQYAEKSGSVILVEMPGGVGWFADVFCRWKCTSSVRRQGFYDIGSFVLRNGDRRG